MIIILFIKYCDGVTFPKVITAHFDNDIYNLHLFAYCENKFKLFCKINLSLSIIIIIMIIIIAYYYYYLTITTVVFAFIGTCRNCEDIITNDGMEREQCDKVNIHG